MKKKLNPKQIFFILLIQLICIPRGVSQECTGSPVHLTGNGNCLEDLPPLSQGATNNCWAFAYSSMVDAHLRCVEGRQSPSDPGGPPAARTRNREGFRMSPWPIPVTNNSTDVVGEVKRRYNSQCREKMMCQTRPGQFKVLGSVASAPNSGGTFDAAHQIFTKNMNGKTCDHRALGFETANGLHGFMEFLKALYRYDHASHSEANTALAQVFDTLEYESNESAFNNLRNIAAYRRQCSEAIAEFESSYVPFLRSDPRENNSSCTYIRGQGMTTDMQAAVHHMAAACTLFNDTIQTGALASLVSFSKRFMSKIDNWDVKNAEEFARKWVNARCASLPRPSLTLPKLISVQGSEASMKQAIDNQLSRGRPAGISMCANIFTGPSSSNYSGVNERSSEHYYCNQQFCDCRPHAVVVVGRKMLNGKCHFIIRNSWGAECGGYSEAQRRAGQCDADRGEISVPADYLMRNTIDANYFE